MRRLLYFSPAWQGGLADYAHAQADALSQCGVAVEVLAPPAFQDGRQGNYKHCPELPAATEATPKTRALRLAGTATLILRQMHFLADTIVRTKADHVLFGSYMEYLAPFWAPMLRRLKASGVVFGAVVHDPVRDFQVGPAWWHRWSIAQSYSVLREAFVHGEISLETGGPRPRVSVIPHGPYAIGSPGASPSVLREKLGIPPRATVLLSFGHIRDGKNLDLVLRAMTESPDVYLVVAGREQSSSQRPVGHYQALAANLGVANRCRWEHRFIPTGEVGDFFAAADFTLLAYSADFHSASAALNVSVTFRKPCIASGGTGNLHSVVRQYGLGLWAEPDDVAALAAAIREARTTRLAPDWEGYERDNSWKKNAEIVAARLFENP